ncbi:hypothetical protein GCM10022235_00740 [Kribbella ginsengisoli]|uniref:Restriction endonuclease type IV Mrr domain-containing protein n=2 Tax=Kribbella ginsengisoli TaxID=363865 RepID=A0ABP6VLB8_9ACTN
MLILGLTADDKGAQLEVLVRTVLEQQGYKNLRTNQVGAGGNELDVVATREAAVIGSVQVTPLMCEAKAYADPVSMPVWQRFLGKLLIERFDDVNTIGMLVALSGINGNVAGSLRSLRSKDSALFVFDGRDLLELAAQRGEVAVEKDVREALNAQLRRTPVRLDAVYYAGAHYWVAWWSGGDYSVVDGHGVMLPSADVEKLRGALEGTLDGTLLATDEARAEAEERHNARVGLLNSLLQGDEVVMDDVTRSPQAAADLADESFTCLKGANLTLLPPDEIGAAEVSRLFLSIFDDVVKVSLLSFMVGRHHDKYVRRLVDLLPEIQSGFTLDENDIRSLSEIAPLFPSVWVTLASENPMITTHRSDATEIIDEAVLAADRAAFWEAVATAIRSDFSNPRLRGFLYDHMGVAELQERNELFVKCKTGLVGHTIRTEVRNAVRQYTDESVSETGPVYVMVRMLPTIEEPWDQEHPPPEFPLDNVG